MSHLGDRVSALADGHLDHQERDRALAHVARCDACRREVEQERRTRALLAELPGPPPSEPLLGALLALGSPDSPPAHRTPPPTPAGAVPSVPRRPAPDRPGGDRPADRADPRRPQTRARSASRARRVRAAAAGALAVAAVGLGVAALGTATPGGSAPVSVIPPVERFAVEHARSTSSLPFVESAVLIVPSDEAEGTADR
ncbi:MAG TPA: zf-HC2 domain-containing protein [Jiangellales bacterium]|nr:zf-HC2 domain-containing protein [Jiangellales bacterium]